MEQILLTNKGVEKKQNNIIIVNLHIFIKAYNGSTGSEIQILHQSFKYSRTNLFYNSFLPSTIRSWNELADEIKTAPSVASFKFRLNRDLHKPPKYFNSGSRQGQILHVRLRMECSSLNAHLYKKNIVPSTSCSCGGFESTYHFFFKCSNYSLIRTRYLPNNLK